MGGGDGQDALPFAIAGQEVTIVDPSRAWLEEAVRRADAAGADDIDVATGPNFSTTNPCVKRTEDW